MKTRKSRLLISRAVPLGSIQPFGGDVAPENYMICDGSTVSRAEFDTLFATIGTFWGYGDNSTTFHLPDLRGSFARGLDKAGSGAESGRDVDRNSRTASNTGGNTGNNVGSFQNKGWKSHSHGNGNHRHGFTARDIGGAYVPNRVTGELGPRDSTGFRSIDNMEVFYFTSQSGSPGSTSNQGGEDTRTENANVRYIIKVK